MMPMMTGRPTNRTMRSVVPWRRQEPVTPVTRAATATACGVATASERRGSGDRADRFHRLNRERCPEPAPAATSAMPKAGRMAARATPTIVTSTNRNGTRVPRSPNAPDPFFWSTL